MINFRQAINFISAEPFRPFRVRTIDGLSFDVVYPDDVAVNVKRMRVNVASEDDNSSQERWQNIPLDLIEGIEPIQIANRLTD